MEEGFVEAVNARWQLVAIRLRDSASYCVVETGQPPEIGQWVIGKLQRVGAYLRDEEGQTAAVTVLRDNCSRAEAFALIESGARESEPPP